MEKFDVIVIGSGVGGMACANPLQNAGKKVAVVEMDLWGGTCPNRGCDPKKVLIGAVEAKTQVRQLQGKGFNNQPKIDWPQLMAFKKTFTDPAPESFQRSLNAAGIETIKGQASFVSQDTLRVGTRQLQAKDIIIATGQRPSLPEIPGAELLHTSTDFLSLSTLPHEMIFLGAGYITFELATIAAACGSQVTIIHHNNRPLKAFDEMLVQEMTTQMAAKGIKFEWDTEITAALTDGNNRVQLRTDDEKSYTADYVVAATGRIPNIEGLSLEKAGVAVNRGGIAVDEFLQTNVSHIYACGDVVAKRRPKLTPVATFEGSYVASRILGETAAINYPLIPTIVYGSPKLAETGQTIANPDAGETETVMDLTQWFTYRRVNEDIAKVKLVKNTEGMLIGASVLSERADDMINYLTFCIQQKLTTEDLTKMIMGYPTLASDLSYLV